MFVWNAIESAGIMEQYSIWKSWKMLIYSRPRVKFVHATAIALQRSYNGRFVVAGRRLTLTVIARARSSRTIGICGSHNQEICKCREVWERSLATDGGSLSHCGESQLFGTDSFANCR